MMKKHPSCRLVESLYKPRATAITLLSDTQVPSRHIMAISGHRSEASLKHFNTCPSGEQLRSCSDILSTVMGGRPQQSQQLTLPGPSNLLPMNPMVVNDSRNTAQHFVKYQPQALSSLFANNQAILTFAEFSSQPINVHFETSGKPIVFSMDGDSTYEADFVLATLVDHQSSTQSSQASVTGAVNASTKSVTKVNSSSKKNLPSQAEKIKQTSDARSGNNTSVTQNLQRANHVNNNEHGDSMFNDDDDDLDMTEIDQAVLEGKAPLLSQETEEKVDKGNMNHNVVEKTGAVSTSQRSADANRSTVLDDFFSDSFPYKDLFTAGKRNLSVIPEASQESANTSVRSARPIQTPPSSATEVSFLKNVDMPSLGDSCISPEVNSVKQSGQKKTRRHDHDDSLMDVVVDEDYDFIPGTPPHKKFKSMFFSTSKSQGVSQDEVLAADSDED